jgi:hypothetical protein
MMTWQFNSVLQGGMRVENVTFAPLRSQLRTSALQMPVTGFFRPLWLSFFLQHPFFGFLAFPNTVVYKFLFC